MQDLGWWRADEHGLAEIDRGIDDDGQKRGDEAASAAREQGAREAPGLVRPGASSRSLAAEQDKSLARDPTRIRGDRLQWQLRDSSICFDERQLSDERRLDVPMPRLTRVRRPPRAAAATARRLAISREPGIR